MLPIAVEPAVRDPRSQAVVPNETSPTTRPEHLRFFPRQDLSTSSRCRANPTANRRTFSAAGNRADDRADRRTAANECTSALIGSETVRLLRADDTVLRLNAISLPVDRNGIQIQRDLVV